MFDSTIEQYQTLNSIYFEKISNAFGYEFSKDAFRYRDVETNNIIIPFYMSELVIDFDSSILVDENTLMVTSKTKDKIIEKNSIYRVVNFISTYTCSVKDGIVQGFSESIKELPLDEKLKEYSVSYEHFSSNCIDPGSSKMVLATDVDNAIYICSSVTYPPDDYISWSFEVYSREDNEHYSDESSCSYLNAIERPGIAKCEAEERQKQKEALVPLSQDNGTSSNLELDLAF